MRAGRGERRSGRKPDAAAAAGHERAFAVEAKRGGLGEIDRCLAAHVCLCAGVHDDFRSLIAHCGTIFQPRSAIMPLGTIIVFRDDGERPHSELVLSGGDRVKLALDGNGLTVTDVGPADPAVLFQADAETVAHICAVGEFAEFADGFAAPDSCIRGGSIGIPRARFKRPLSTPRRRYPDSGGVGAGPPVQRRTPTSSTIAATTMTANVVSMLATRI